jgi:hypothetical protein
MVACFPSNVATAWPTMAIGGSCLYRFLRRRIYKSASEFSIIHLGIEAHSSG